MSTANDASFTRWIIRIAIAAIAVSMVVMILTTAIIAGFKKEITQKIFGFWGHIHITDSNINRNFELKPISKDLEYFQLIKDIQQVDYQKEAKVLGYTLEDQYVDKVTNGGVQGVYPFIIMPGILKTKTLFHGALLKGVGSDYNWTALEKFIVEGKKIEYLKDSSSAQILISKNIADKMFIKVGDKVQMSFIWNKEQIKRRFEVCGIYNTGLEEYDKRFGIVDIQKLQEVLQWPTTDVQGMEVVLDDVADMDVIGEYIYYEILPQEYYAETIRSKFPSIFEWLGLQDVNEKTILGLMALVAIINMITALLILILERTEMIGILKSCGMNNWSVRKIFLYNAGYIILYGLGIGNIIGLTLAFLQKQFAWIKLDEANYYLHTAPIYIDWSVVLIINLVTFVLTLLFLIIPTMLVTRITPVRALRFQ